MDQARRELLVARVCSGSVRLKLDGRRGPVVLLYKGPTRDQRYYAHELYEEVFVDSQENGLYSDQELYEFLLEQNLWDDEQEKLLDPKKGLPHEIEQFKLALFKATFRSNERKSIRKALTRAREKFGGLSARRHSYDHLSCSGAAAAARSRYISGCSLRYLDGRPVFTDDTFWEDSSDLLDSAISAYNARSVSEPDFRDTARNEPWRSLWLGRKAEGSLFGCNPVDYTDDQRNLLCWSNLYDSIYQHPDCPADDILSDDDMLDGWMIDQRNRREESQLKKHGEEGLSEKTRNKQEVYMMAETLDDAKRVEAMNDPHAAAVKKQRMNFLKKKGEVNELEMPDTAQRLRMEVTQKFAQSLRGG